jgi:hypothetical protein
MIDLLEFLALSPEERRPYFTKAAAHMNLPPNLIEKDFWVSFLLDLLFKLPSIGKSLTFKGGTSLSKVYGIIRRFSEDVDLTIEKSHFGFHGHHLPESAPSSNQREKLLNELSAACKSYVQGELFAAIETALSKSLPVGAAWKLSVDDVDKDGQTLNFAYPTVGFQATSYVAPWVKIEFGSRGEHWPVEQRVISSYLHSSLSADLAPWNFAIKALSPSRTFWEKATILHMYANYPEGKIVPERQSRHYYDFFCLLRSDAKGQALRDIHLLTDVCNHKSVYFRSAAAKYDEAKSGKLRLIPANDVLMRMGTDYEKMAEMIFDEPVEWELIVQELEQFEKEMEQ